MTVPKVEWFTVSPPCVPLAPKTRWPERLAAPVRAGDTTAMSFWQSRQGLARPPQLTDLRELARAIWRTPCPFPS